MQLRIAVGMAIASIGWIMSCRPATAQDTNAPSLSMLVQRVVPACRIETAPDGKPLALKSESGELLDLKTAARENPTPQENVVGYWFSPTMNFLGSQNAKAATADQAVDVVRLYHALWRGPAFVEQKRYHARRIDVGWVVEVDHDFTKYPGMIQEVQPYELVLSGSDQLVKLRQRCYSYLGGAQIYTNTIQSVYEREIKRDGGVNYPEKIIRCSP